MSAIIFETNLIEINTHLIAHLPLEASAKVPTRGLAMVKGTVNGVEFQTALEPDGRKSHWFEIDDQIQEILNVHVGDTVKLSIEPTKDWIEPKVPADIMTGISSDAPAYALWQDITPLARWEWIRWIRATNRAETRAKHIEVASSKLRFGARRPCCFNASMCTVPEVSKNGVLLTALRAIV